MLFYLKEFGYYIIICDRENAALNSATQYAHLKRYDERNIITLESTSILPILQWGKKLLLFAFISFFKRALGFPHKGNSPNLDSSPQSLR